jgi:hypothetical protein
VSHRHDDADPVEHDPTGMRALLGSLPDPGPMPDRLVARITAALEEEARTTGGGATTEAGGWVPPPAPEGVAVRDLGGSGHDDDRTVVPLRRRRPWLLGAAAAAVVALVAGGVVVDRLSAGGLQASLGLAQGANDSAAGAAADSATESTREKPEDGGSPTGEAATGSQALAGPVWTPAAADAGLGVRVLEGEGTSTGDLEAVVARLRVPAYAAFPTDSGAPLPASRETLGWPQGARDCATGLEVPKDVQVVVLRGEVDGDRAGVVVALEPGGVRRAWVVGPTCSRTEPDVRSGPVTVG